MIPQRKDNIAVPKQIIFASDEIKIAFLRGLAYSDFTFTVKNKEGLSYPVVRGASKSRGLMDDVCILLRGLKIGRCIYNEKYFDKELINGMPRPP